MQLSISKIDLLVSSKIYNFYLKKIRYLDCFLEELNFVTDILFYLIMFFLFFTKHFLSLILAAISYEITVFIQKYFDRIRPYEFFKIDHTNYSARGHSFPSSHSSTSVFILLLYHTVPVAWLLIFIPILRILSLNHWITDVLGGILLGTLFFIIITAMTKFILFL